MKNPLIEEQQQQTCNNLHQGALAMLDIKDEVDAGNFATADQMLAKLEEAVAYTRVAVQGMKLLQEVQDI